MSPFLITLGAIVLVAGAVLLWQYATHALCACGVCEADRAHRKATQEWRLL